MDQRNVYRPEPRPSSFLEHGRSIIVGVLIIVLAAAALSAFSSVREPICDFLSIEACSTVDPDDRIYGAWDFASSNPNPLPQSMPGVTPEYSSLVVSEDGSFIMDGAQVFDDGTRLPFRSTGTFEFSEADEIHVFGGEDGTLQGTNRLSFEGENIMHMIDAPTGYVITWRRRG